jgi:hypothetical protein
MEAERERRLCCAWLGREGEHEFKKEDRLKRRKTNDLNLKKTDRVSKTKQTEKCM